MYILPRVLATTPRYRTDFDCAELNPYRLHFLTFDVSRADTVILLGKMRWVARAIRQVDALIIAWHRDPAVQPFGYLILAAIARKIAYVYALDVIDYMPSERTPKKEEPLIATSDSVEFYKLLNNNDIRDAMYRFNSRAEYWKKRSILVPLPAMVQRSKLLFLV